MQKNEKGPLSHQKIKCSFLDYVQLLMIGQAIQAKNVDQTIKKQKGPLSYQKIKCSFLDYVQLLMIRQVKKKKKRPPKLSKIKCSFLDYVQLLMIGQAIQAKNIDWNGEKQKRPPKSLENKMFIFWIMFNFWWSAKWSKQKTLTKMYRKQKRSPKSSKNKMFIFGSCSTSDDQPSALRK